MAKTIIRKAIVPFTPEQMFALVNDIESYPQFIPQCLNARIIDRSETQLEAELTVGKGHLKHSFTTRNKLFPPQRMTLELKEGPFKTFDGYWAFAALDTGCEVAFSLTFEFSSTLLKMTAGSIIEAIASQQVDAICQRAQSVYGNA